MKNWLYNKTVVISGASGGIGFNIAKLLIQKYNCKIIGIARNEQKLLNAIEQLGEKKSNFTYKIFDVCIKQNWIDFSNFLQKSNTNIDVLINNAGFMLPFDKLQNLSDNDVEEIVSTNFMSYIMATKILMPHLLKSNSPALINISSAAGRCPVVGQTMYCATKYGIRGFTDTIRLELGKNFYVAGVYPGFIKTNILNRMSINDKNNKLINKLMKPVDKASKIIVNKLSKKRKNIVLGLDGCSMNFFMKVMPNSTPYIVKNVLKASKLEIFNNIFEKKEKN